MDRTRGFVVPVNGGLPTGVRVPNRQLKVRGIHTGGAFMVTEYVLAADIPPHVHVNQHECFYVLGGAVTVHVGTDDLDAGPGDFVFLPSDVPHSLTAATDRPPRLLAIATPNARNGGIWPVASGTADVWPHSFPPGWAWAAGPGAGAGPAWARPAWG